jgi:hypothetical protein
VQILRGVPRIGYRWWTVTAWRWGVKLGPVTVQVVPAVDISVLSQWRMRCR